MENKFKLTLIEALCIVNCGWKTEQERELFDFAKKVVENKSLKQHLQYQLCIVNKKLEELN